MVNPLVRYARAFFVGICCAFVVATVAVGWSGPGSSAPSGNVSAPINTGSTDQVKTGGLGVTNFTATNAALTGYLAGSGSETSYGAFTVRGSRSGWSGINFKDSGGSNYGTLMMHPSYSGFYNVADNGWRWYVDNSGNSYQPGYSQASAYYYNSDERLKDNIKTLEGSLQNILKLRGTSFNWIESGEATVGLIAQEVETVYPELVTTNSQGTKAVEYGKLIAPLIEAVKEQHQLIQEQEERIRLLEQQLRNNTD